MGLRKIPWRKHRLCYIDGDGDYKRAYFTSSSLDEQWGDDWNDAPYEHNAGTPYRHDGQSILSILFSSSMETPADVAGLNSRYSVQDINRGAAPWLSPNRYDLDKNQPDPIMAGASIKQFKRTVRASGGTIYKADNR